MPVGKCPKDNAVPAFFVYWSSFGHCSACASVTDLDLTTVSKQYWKSKAESKVHVMNSNVSYLLSQRNILLIVN